MARNLNPLSIPTSNALGRLSLFGPPPLLEGEDTAAYDELLVRVSGDVNPKDIFEEMWVRDIVDITWEIFRWRRLKTSLLAAATPQALERMLASINGTDSAETSFLALESFGPKPSSPEHKLAKKWAARNPTAINRVNELMASANVTMDTVMAKALVEEFDYIERIDRLATVAEARRNAVLREIDHHRTSFAHALRERVRNVEEAEFKIVESKSHSVGKQ